MGRPRLRFVVPPYLPEVLAVAAGPVWNADLPRPLQQVLFDTADAISP